MAMKRKNLPELVPHVFEHEQFGSIRVVIIDGKPWFVGKDIAKALGYKNPRDALAKHVDAEDKRVILKSQFATLDTTLEIPNRGLIVINKSGVYSLILDSQLPKAKEFRHWVTSEVLVKIDETGSYSVPHKKKKELPQLPPNFFDGIENDFTKAVKIITFLEENNVKCDYELVPEVVMGEDGKPTMCYNFELVIKD